MNCISHRSYEFELGKFGLLEFYNEAPYLGAIVEDIEKFFKHGVGEQTIKR